eukprot:2312009-Amphidinium_carterae.1
MAQATGVHPTSTTLTRWEPASQASSRSTGCMNSQKRQSACQGAMGMLKCSQPRNSGYAPYPMRLSEGLPQACAFVRMILEIACSCPGASLSMTFGLGTSGHAFFHADTPVLQELALGRPAKPKPEPQAGVLSVEGWRSKPVPSGVAHLAVRIYVRERQALANLPKLTCS